MVHKDHRGWFWSPVSRPTDHEWRKSKYTSARMAAAASILHKAHGYPPSCRLSLHFSRYYYILLGEQRHVFWITWPRLLSESGTAGGCTRGCKITPPGHNLEYTWKKAGFCMCVFINMYILSQQLCAKILHDMHGKFHKTAAVLAEISKYNKIQ